VSYLIAIVSAAYCVGQWLCSTIKKEDEPVAFTRYWVRPKELEAESFARFSAACEKACKKFPGKLIDAVFNSEVVRFNAEPGCQAFVIERVSTDEDLDGDVFDFCKTCHLPYDAIVARCLALLKEHFPKVTVTRPF
jgi:hypothetical protein